jgi:hypothetical protein
MVISFLVSLAVLASGLAFVGPVAHGSMTPEMANILYIVLRVVVMLLRYVDFTRIPTTRCLSPASWSSLIRWERIAFGLRGSSVKILPIGKEWI